MKICSPSLKPCKGRRHLRSYSWILIVFTGKALLWSSDIKGTLHLLSCTHLLLTYRKLVLNIRILCLVWLSCEVIGVWDLEFYPCHVWNMILLDIRWVALLFYFRWLGAITLPRLGPFFQFSLRSVSLFSLIFILNSLFIVEDVELHQLNVKAPISSIPSMCSFLFHFEWNVCPWKMQNLPIKIACCYFYSADLYFLFFLKDG